jgi:hypothetical protein
MNYPSIPIHCLSGDHKIKQYYKQAWALIITWAGFILLALLAGGGKLIAPFFPVSAVTLGIYLYSRTPLLYVGFAWWMIFLGALIRRIIDYQAGYITFGRWSMTATLVMSISLMTLCKKLPKSYKDGGLPFILAIGGIMYAFLIGGIAYDKLNAKYCLLFLEWFAPVGFGFHLFTQWRNYPQHSRLFQKVFVVGTLVMGGYGIYQFCVAPPWDNFFLIQTGVSSFGRPIPFGIRVFGTLTAPQTFATVLLAGLILSLSSFQKIGFLTTVIGVLSFLLTRARAGWLGFCAAALIYFPLLSQRLQIRLVITILVMLLAIVPLVNMEPFSEVVQSRLSSFESNDVSLQARQKAYNQTLDLALSEVVGRGLGGGVAVQGFGSADSGVLPLLFSFGWIGAIPYLVGSLIILFKLFQEKNFEQDTFGNASRSIALGVFVQIIFNNIFVDEYAFVFWSFLGIGLAGCKYYKLVQPHNIEHVTLFPISDNITPLDPKSI